MIFKEFYIVNFYVKKILRNYSIRTLQKEQLFQSEKCLLADLKIFKKNNLQL